MWPVSLSAGDLKKESSEFYEKSTLNKKFLFNFYGKFGINEIRSQEI